MSESLAWEKWSSFSHNRYVEEAERYSRPGSVAQKKAFFEAHYKKLAAQKAAALLEQANNGAQNNATGPEEEGVNDNVTHSNDNDNVTHQNDNDTVIHNSQTSPNSEMVVEVEQDAKVLALTPESVKVEGTEAVMEEVAVVGNSMEVELQNQLEDLDDAQREQNVTVTPVLTPLVKVSISDQEILADVGKKKPPVSSFKLLSSKANGTSKFTSTPVKSTAAISYKKENIASPMSIKPANGTSKFTTTPSTAAISFRRDNIVTPVNNMPVGLSTADKKRSTPRSVNFTPIRELNRLTASVMRKFESTRAGAGPSKASKDNFTPIRTPTMVGIQEQLTHSEIPKDGRKSTPTMAESKTYFPPNRSVLKTSGTKHFQGKSGRTLTHPLTSTSHIIPTHENASPNIQHGYLHSRNYKY
ncbi:hypothetical protein V8G54_011625 [Vigna mungo]|uniref:TPX2 C-terminal domain-containing protein n=1 Tax=Vigna mungo TaxID=3915 RepID=A0AAQ3S383_VIGMU